MCYHRHEVGGAALGRQQEKLGSVMTIPFDARSTVDELLAMPFDQYQRYRLSAELVVALKHAANAADDRWRILDVGGYFPTRNGVLPIASFLPDDDTLVVDTVDHDGPGYRRASGTDLPFADRAFDVVVSCDTLEHVPPDGRGAFLDELRRVAGRAVVLAAPHATAGVGTAELALAEYLRSFNHTNHMLDEHLAYGLPDPAWVDQWLEARGAAGLAFPSGYVPRWQLMMFLKHQLLALPDTDATHQQLDQTYNRQFYERDQRGPGYRRVYVLATDGALPPALDAFVERAARPEPEHIAADLLGLAVLPIARALTETIMLRQSFRALERQYQQLSEMRTTLLSDLQHAVRQAAMLEGEKRALQQQLEMLGWQNQMLHQQLASRNGVIAWARRVGQRVRRMRRGQPGGGADR